MPPLSQEFKLDIQPGVGEGQTMQNASFDLSPTTGFNFDVPERIPSPVFDSSIGTEDVFQKREQFAQNQQSQTQIESALNEITNRVGNNGFTLGSAGTFQEFINDRLFGEQELTDAQKSQQNLLDQGVKTTEGIGDDLTAVRNNASNEFGVAGLSDALSETNENIARREQRHRRDIREFKENAEVRGVAREFVQGNLKKMEADATAELADLYIIQAAQSGNLERAEGLVSDAVQARKDAFDIEVAQIEAQLARLKPTLEGEALQRAEQLEYALSERKRLLDQNVADEKTKREYLAEAAANGASTAVLNQILAGTVDEAAAAAGPYLGLQDRLTAEANRANIYSQIRKRRAEMGDGSATNTVRIDNEIDRASTILKNTFEALDEVGFGTAGIGSLTKFIPGTPARNLSGTVDTIKANLGFSELQAMREASPTGGALGQVAVKELEFLQAALSNLDVGLSPEELTENLTAVKTHYTNWVNTVGLANGREFEVTKDGIIEITD